MRGLALGMVLAVALLGPGVASAHNAGRVELLITNLKFEHTGQGVTVSAHLIDRDSGAQAAGFAIVVSASAANGASAGPIALTDPGGTGRYEGFLPIAVGSWTVTARAEQGASALPALGSTRVAEVKVGGSGVVQSADAPEATTTTVPQYGTRPVNITLEVRTDYPDTLPSSLYIPLRARLTDVETGQPVADPYTVRASVRVPGQSSTEAYDFAYPHGTVEGAEPGVYNGVVIVPAGGRWTVVVNAYNTKEAETARLPHAVGGGQIEVEATGPALQTAQGRRSNDVAGNLNPRAETSEVALLFLHSIVAGLWFALAALLALLALPNRRRFLAGHLSELLDRNVRKLTRGFFWTTVVVWGTGLLNLQKAVAFPPPLSSAQATRLFRLPYAKPYTLALYTKIGLYAVLTVGALALVKEARRRVAEFDEARFRAERAERAEAAAASGAGPVVPPAGAIPLTPRRAATALATRPAPAVAQRPTTNGSPAAAVGTAYRVAAASLALGGVAIVFCVTVLKYCHILSEAVRGLQ